MSPQHIKCCIPIALEARTIGPWDRRAFARRSIREGEVIIRNLPVAYFPVEERRAGRCWHCLSRSPLNHSAIKTTALLRCSRCQQARYCSRVCQQRDFACHKFECRESTLLFGKEAQSMGSNDDAVLLVRNFLKLREKEFDCNCLKIQGCTTVCCGSTHFENLIQYTHGPLSPQETEQASRAAQVLWNQRKKIQKLYSKSKTEIFGEFLLLQQRMERDLRKFRSNNFGVTDSMIRVVASAVYPLGALLNHSCAPNCLLRYILRSGEQESPIMEIVAAKNIDIGEELTHSYVELISSTATRQAKLKAVYGFDCNCFRCHPLYSNQFCIQLPSSRASMQPSELVRWILKRYNPTISHGNDEESSLAKLQQESILATLADREAVKRAQEKLRRAKICAAEGVIEQELDALEKAVNLLELASASAFTSDPLAAMASIELYQARGERLGALIIANQTTEAISECEFIVAFLALALNHLPNHSLMGLQLFTLGDLYEASDVAERAMPIFKWARKILRVSHGTSNDLVDALNAKLMG